MNSVRIALPDDWKQAVNNAARRAKVTPEQWVRLAIFRQLPTRVRTKLSNTLSEQSDDTTLEQH